MSTDRLDFSRVFDDIDELPGDDLLKPSDRNILLRERVRPSEAYEALDDPDACTAELIGLLLNQVEPYLPFDVVAQNRENGSPIPKIIQLRDRLLCKYRDILVDHGLSSLAENFIRRRRFSDVSDICREIPEEELREKIRSSLAKEREFITADFLEILGFLPSGVFSREDEIERQWSEVRQIDLFGNRHISKDTIRYNVEGKTLAESFPPWFPREAFGSPERLAENLLPEQTEEYHRLAPLARWIVEANRDFRQAVQAAFADFSVFFEQRAPKGPDAQRFEPISDLGTKRFAGLLDEVLDIENSIRTRFEALRLLEWAIAEFSIRRNPVYQAQGKVRRAIHEILETDFWSPAREFPALRIPARIDALVQEEETKVRQDSDLSEREPKFFRARKLSLGVSEILSGYRDLFAPNSRSSAVFDSRDKDPFSTARKIFLAQEDVANARAAFSGRDISMSRYCLSKLEAEQIMGKFRNIMHGLGRTDNEFEIKPVSLDSIQDTVAFSLAFNFAKPLADLDDKEKSRAEAMLDEIAELLIRSLRLKYFSKRSNLFGKDNNNGKSSPAFRDIKVLGYWEVEIEAFEHGAVAERTILVPVEFQLLPVESRLRTFYPGPTSHSAYKERQNAALDDRIHPQQIGENQIYSERLTLDELSAIYPDGDD